MQIAGYTYSISLFLFLCALTLSYKGIAFTPLHLQLKSQLLLIVTHPDHSDPVDQAPRKQARLSQAKSRP